MFVFNREDVTTMGIAQAVITAIDITAAVVDLTRVDALTNRTVLARSAVQSTRTSTMDIVEASSNREDGVHGRDLTVTTVAVDKDTLVRDMGRITIGGSAWLVVPATVAARKQSAVLVVVANHGRGQENTVRAKGPIFTTVAASRDMNARTLEWESTGANV